MLKNLDSPRFDKRFAIYQRMAGFIANSSGSAYFQFYMFETAKNTGITGLLESIDIQPYSVAHEIVKDIGVLEKIAGSKKTEGEFEAFLEETCPDGYATEKTRDILKWKYGQVQITNFENNDYFADYIGCELESMSEFEGASLGFLYLMNFKEGSTSRFVAEDVYYRTY